jgi:glycosyltransferase involved in cell wall biosynthesis
VTTTRIRETWGLVLNEAMNQGVPVVTSTAVGAAAGGMIRDGETGLVVPERDSAALAAALGRLLADPALRRRIGEAGRHEVVQWTQERMAAGFLRALEYAYASRALAR